MGTCGEDCSIFGGLRHPGQCDPPVFVVGLRCFVTVVSDYRIGFDTGFDHADATSRNKHLPNNVSLRVMYACIVCVYTRSRRGPY